MVKKLKFLFRNNKDKTLKTIKRMERIIAIIVAVLSFATFLCIPFLHNVIDKTVGKIIWYPLCLFVTIIYIIDILKSNTKKQTNNDYLIKVGIVPIIGLFGSAFVINYYETDYNWWWALFVFVLVFAPITILYGRYFAKKQNNISSGKSIISLKTCWKYIIFYWLIDLFYMSGFNYWLENSAFREKWLLPQFIFGVIVMVFIFYNLTLAFLSNPKKQWFGLLQDFILGIGITIYLIFLIPDDALQTIVLTIIAAVYGGLLTLVGVAWTIKDANNKRQEDLKRTDIEHKEEERKKHIPYVKLSCVNNEPITEVNACISEILDLKDPNDLAQINKNHFYIVNINDFVIKNISKENIIIKGILVYGVVYNFVRQEILEPNHFCRIKASNNWSLCVPNLDTKIILIVNDVLENTYEIRCEINEKIGDFFYQTDIDDKKYTGINYDYYVTNVSLPKLVENK